MASEAPVEDIFAGMKKKKKSSKKVDFGSLDLDSPATVTEPTAAPADEASTPAESAEITQTEAQSAAVTQDSGELDFSDLKKKKKKKTVRIAEDDDEESQVAQPKKKTTDALGNEIVETEDGPVDTSAAPNSVATDDFDDFADLKKKKKKGTKKNVFDLEAFEKELAQTESEISSTATSAAPGKPLKSALVSKTSTPGESDGEDAAGDDMDEDVVPTGEDPFAANQTEEQTLSKAEQAATAKVWLKEGSRDYHYDELLGRFYQMLFQSHPSLSGGAGKKKYTIPPPQLGREGSKRSVFANVGEICKRMHRQPEHVIQFVFAELGTTGSVDGSGRLIIKGRFQQKQMENVLRRYIVEYVTCRTCKSPDTLLTKDNRLFFMTCESCGSTRSVSAIKTGFQAQTGKRKAMKAAGQ